MTLELTPVRENGTADGVDIAHNPTLQYVIPEIVANYKRVGFAEPWISYIATDDGAVVGTCAFKTPPKQGRVEIVYFTFPQYENNGFATKMAEYLVQIAQDTDDSLQIIARTLPINGPSASVLKKNGFKKTGEVLDPDDGLVWEWEYRKS